MTAPAASTDVVTLRDLDEPGRVPALVAFVSAVAWLLVGSLLGLVASLKFNFPDWWTGWAPATFGRVRAAHLNAMIYGWASLAMLGISVWLVPRLVHAPLRWPRVATGGIVFWNGAILVGVLALLAGWTDGLEWLEFPRSVVDPMLIVAGGMVGVTLLGTVLGGRARHLYVSVWYVAAAFVWFPIIFVTGNLPVFRGVESAAVNWFYAHNALGFWLTAIGLGAVYYFIPKVLGRPIYSYQLSLLGFWTLAFFYALNGMHHLIGGPLPTWMITTSIVASVLMVIPVAAVAVNHHMSMVGRFASLRYSPTLRFVVLGAVAYTAVSLQGIFTAFREVNRITHFTHWTIAHSHVGVYAFVTFVMFGSVYYVIPRLVGRDWPDGRLIAWHFWLALGGIGAFVLALNLGGVLQGLALMDPQVPFQASVEAAAPWLAVRSLAGVVLTAAHLVFAWHLWKVLRRAPTVGPLPPWHDPRPVVVPPPGPWS
ncbi:cbb3-type cytochrome c oxidase subunit I [Myxococcota bacterium]|nr:cbb3-type cytochrome c oxidase subunit I [Myxococcota bacterium]